MKFAGEVPWVSWVHRRMRVFELVGEFFGQQTWWDGLWDMKGIASKTITLSININDLLDMDGKLHLDSSRGT